MKWEVAIHRWRFNPAPSAVLKHAEELSGLLNSGFIFVSQVTVCEWEEPHGYILTTFKREMRGQ